MIQWFRGMKRVLKKTKIVFGETEKWITFAELSPEKIGKKVEKWEYEQESSLKIFEKERRQNYKE